MHKGLYDLKFQNGITNWLLDTTSVNSGYFFHYSVQLITFQVTLHIEFITRTSTCNPNVKRLRPSLKKFMAMHVSSEK